MRNLLAGVFGLVIALFSGPGWAEPLDVSSWVGRLPDSPGGGGGLDHVGDNESGHRTGSGAVPPRSRRWEKRVGGRRVRGGDAGKKTGGPRMRRSAEEAGTVRSRATDGQRRKTGNGRRGVARRAGKTGDSRGVCRECGELRGRGGNWKEISEDGRRSRVLGGKLGSGGGAKVQRDGAGKRKRLGRGSRRIRGESRMLDRRERRGGRGKRMEPRRRPLPERRMEI